MNKKELKEEVKEEVVEEIFGFIFGFCIEIVFLIFGFFNVLMFIHLERSWWSLLMLLNALLFLFLFGLFNMIRKDDDGEEK